LLTGVKAAPWLAMTGPARRSVWRIWCRISFVCAHYNGPASEVTFFVLDIVVAACMSVGGLQGDFK